MIPLILSIIALLLAIGSCLFGFLSYKNLRAARKEVKEVS